MEEDDEASYIELVQYSRPEIPEDEINNEQLADQDLMKSRGDLKGASVKIAPEDITRVEESVTELLGD